MGNERPSSAMSHKSSGGVGRLWDCLAAVVLTECTWAAGVNVDALASRGKEALEAA